MAKNKVYKNVPEDLSVCVDPAFGKAVEDAEGNKKRHEEGQHTNDDLTKGLVPDENYTGKKVTSSALKAMHLSEALFENYGKEDLRSEVYNALAEIAFAHQDMSEYDFDLAYDWFSTHFWEDEADYLGEGFNYSDYKNAPKRQDMPEAELDDTLSLEEPELDEEDFVVNESIQYKVLKNQINQYKQGKSVKEGFNPKEYIERNSKYLSSQEKKNLYKMI